VRGFFTAARCARAAVALAASFLVLCGPSLLQAESEEGFFTNTPLEDAIRGGDITAATLQVRRGADVNQVGSRGRTMLMWAASAKVDAAKLVDLLLEAGADPDAQGDEEVTPLYFGIRNPDLEVTKALIAGGATVDRMQGNSTALHYAVAGFRLILIETLVAAGADTHRPDQNGRSALEMAKSAVGSRALLIAIERGEAARH
jgi:ankyrin repeat protein